MKAETEKRWLTVWILTGGSARAAEGRGERRRGGGSVRVEEQREKRGGRKSRIKPSRQTDDGTGIKQQKRGIICQMSARHPEEYFRLWRNILLIVFHFLPDFFSGFDPAGAAASCRDFSEGKHTYAHACARTNRVQLGTGERVRSVCERVLTSRSV